MGRHRIAYLNNRQNRQIRRGICRFNLTRFERQEDAGVIDWSDRRAVFSLCMHCGWNAGELGRRLGVQATTITAWWDKGCPSFSVRHYARLTALAREIHFDAGMLVEDHLWTVELARAAVVASGLTHAAFAQLAGCHPALVRDAVQGRRRVNRAMAYHLTRAAAKLNLPLPPRGRIEPKHRAPRPFPTGSKGPQGKQVWKPVELALLGTMPDKEVAARLPDRSYVAVLRMRRLLGMKPIPRREWDGTPGAAQIPLADLLQRYYSRFGMEPPA